MDNRIRKVRFLSDSIDHLSNRRLQTTLLSGASIGANAGGTAGLFITNENNEMYGITCGHVLGKKSTQRYVEQPSTDDYNRYLASLEKQVASLRDQVEETSNVKTKYARGD